MRLAISNIAWDVPEDENIAELLLHFGIDAIDVAPGKYFPKPSEATDSEINRIKSWWAGYGIEITGMQSLLFGTNGLNVFGSQESQDEMTQHLSAICRIGGSLGAKRLVFGSPRNRDRTGLTDQETTEIALSFFSRLGEIAKENGVCICLEPNPTCYGANFMTTSDETAKIVKMISHPAIKMQLDTGAMTINNEDVSSVLQHYAHLIGHIHASEPQLLPLGDGQTNHSQIAPIMQRYLPNHIVSIEMLATKNEPQMASIERALHVAKQNYQNNGAKT